MTKPTSLFPTLLRTLGLSSTERSLRREGCLLRPLGQSESVGRQHQSPRGHSRRTSCCGTSCVGRCEGQGSRHSASTTQARRLDRQKMTELAELTNLGNVRET